LKVISEELKNFFIRFCVVKELKFSRKAKYVKDVLIEAIKVSLTLIGSIIKLPANILGFFAIKYNIASAPIDCPVP
jgi:hypothetical protein